MTTIAAPTEEQVIAFYACLEAKAKGETNAKKSQWLSTELGLGRNGDRALRALANAATDMGLLVCSGNNGYWIPETPAEAEETIGRLRSQGIKMLERAKALETLVSKNFPPAGVQIPLVL